MYFTTPARSPYQFPDPIMATLSFDMFFIEKRKIIRIENNSRVRPERGRVYISRIYIKIGTNLDNPCNDGIWK